jgi:hypothetical protein
MKLPDYPQMSLSSLALGRCCRGPSRRSSGPRPGDRSRSRGTAPTPSGPHRSASPPMPIQTRASTSARALGGYVTGHGIYGWLDTPAGRRRVKCLLDSGAFHCFLSRTFAAQLLPVCRVPAGHPPSVRQVDGSTRPTGGAVAARLVLEVPLLGRPSLWTPPCSGRPAAVAAFAAAAAAAWTKDTLACLAEIGHTLRTALSSWLATSSSRRRARHSPCCRTPVIPLTLQCWPTITPTSWQVHRPGCPPTAARRSSSSSRLDHTLCPCPCP